MEISSKKEVAIIIIVYNSAELMRTQCRHIKKFCKDDFDIIIIDNSDNNDVVQSIQHNAKKDKCLYHKTQAASKGGSESHAFACNIAWHKYAEMYKYFCFLDHDNFPIKDFSIKNILENKVMAGLHQIKPSGKEYFWAGCVMFDSDKIEKHLINFSPNNELGLDTGGNLYRVVEKYGKQSCVFFNEVHCENPYFHKSFYNFYALINDSMFMHFINSSNWNNSNDNQERINSLINILAEKTPM